ncbi:HORMA-1 domain-containing protein [Halocola ammonii]
MYNSHTSTYTVVDIRKSFESFQADLRMIARRTNTWDMNYIEKVFHDILKLAEAKYLEQVDIVLLDSNGQTIRAAKYKVSTNGQSMSGDRAGGNDWSEVEGATLTTILKHNADWKRLGNRGQRKFQEENGFKVNWSPSKIDTAYQHLKKEKAQSYSNKGYELTKINYR